MIKFDQAVKKYGNTRALNGVDLSITDNGIYCLLGRNGAGKTTLLKAMAGHIPLSSGEITIDGKKVDTLDMPDISFIESQGQFFNMRVRDLIAFSKKFSDNFDVEFANLMVQKFKLDTGKRYKQLSFGMKTMVAAILSLSGGNKIVVLDEPVLGFDAIMRDRFYTLIVESLELRPRIIIVSTHIIDEIARAVNKVIIIDKGKILEYFDITEIDEKAYSITGMTADIEKAAAGLNVTGKKSVGGFTTAFVFDKRIAPPAHCTVQAMSLQDYFVQLVGGDEHE